MMLTIVLMMTFVSLILAAHSDSNSGSGSDSDHSSNANHSSHKILRCYKCTRCNVVVRTWSKVNCSGTCVKKEVTHKFAKPGEASSYLCNLCTFVFRKQIYCKRVIKPWNSLPAELLHFDSLFSFFNVRQSYCARYSHRLDVCLSVRPFVRPTHAGIVSKRLNVNVS